MRGEYYRAENREADAYLQSLPDDSGSVGQHAQKDVEQGSQQCGCWFCVGFIVPVQAQSGSFCEHVTDVTNES